MKGKVKCFSKQKRSGIITTEESEEISVHYNVIISDGYKTLKKGDDVVFEIENGKKGKQAVNVTKVEKGKEAPRGSNPSKGKENKNTRIEPINY